MNTFVDDVAGVGTSNAAAFQMVQQGVTDAQVILRNTGAATINYAFEANNGSTWAALDVPGTAVNNTLTSLQVRLIPVQADYPQVRLMANAASPTTLSFSVTRNFDRLDGGNIPIMTL